MAPDLTQTVSTVNMQIFPSGFTTNVRAEYFGFFEVVTAGNYIFYVSSDDGERTYIDGIKLMEYWAGRGITTDTGTVNLALGWHNILVEFF